MYSRNEVSSQASLCAKWKILNSNLIRDSKSLFLDRDGVVIVDHGYVNTLSKTNLVEETLQIMRIANKNAVPISIITNQAGVAHGLFSEKDLIEYNLDLLNLLKTEAEVEINGLYYCPSHPEGKEETYRRSCDCRKPMTGLFKESITDSGAVFTRSMFIGDKESDEESARRLGMRYLMYPDSNFLAAMVTWLTS
jgi:D-glycero-D-manno-heptose 1,7-bisphosphate phosphatase